MNTKHTPAQNFRFCIRKLGDLYYQVVRIGDMYGYNIYDKFGKGREILETQEDSLVDDPKEAESNARDAISYHWD